MNRDFYKNFETVNVLLKMRNALNTSTLFFQLSKEFGNFFKGTIHF